MQHQQQVQQWQQQQQQQDLRKQDGQHSSFSGWLLNPLPVSSMASPT